MPLQELTESLCDRPARAGMPWTYFVHSYAAPVGPDTVATCRYGSDVCAAVACGNLWACQFHPEKSGRVGLQVLANFVGSLAGVSA